MKNNDIFNFRRFGKYFASDFRSCAANYGLSLIAMVLLTYIGNYFGHALFGLLIEQTWICPQAGVRSVIFIVLMLCIIVTGPVNCYGKLTEKQYGSFWISIPASGLEKFISMILMSCLVIPAVAAGLYLATDALFCAIDPRCGENVTVAMIELVKSVFDPNAGRLEQGGRVFMLNGATLFKTPWIFADDILAAMLPFILGAITFKKGKTVKTFLCLAALGAFTSAVSLPLMTNFIGSMNEITMSGDPTVAELEALFDKSIFRNMALYDTINDTVFNLALLTAIYFRIKTLKH